MIWRRFGDSYREIGWGRGNVCFSFFSRLPGNRMKDRLRCSRKSRTLVKLKVMLLPPGKIGQETVTFSVCAFITARSSCWQNGCTHFGSHWQSSWSTLPSLPRWWPLAPLSGRQFGSILPVLPNPSSDWGEGPSTASWTWPFAGLPQPLCFAWPFPLIITWMVGSPYLEWSIRMFLWLMAPYIHITRPIFLIQLNFYSPHHLAELLSKQHAAHRFQVLRAHQTKFDSPGSGMGHLLKGVFWLQTQVTTRRDGDERNLNFQVYLRVLSHTNEIMNRIRVVSYLGVNCYLSSKCIALSLPIWGFQIIFFIHLGK